MPDPKQADELRKMFSALAKKALESADKYEEIMAAFDDTMSAAEWINSKKIQSATAEAERRGQLEGRVEAAIQLDPCIDPEFREQYEYLFSTYETELATLTAKKETPNAR